MTAPVNIGQADEGRLLQRLLGHGLARPDADALICEGQVLSWGALRSRVLKLAAAIRARIGDGGEVVALVGDTGCEIANAYLAAIAAGHCAVPLQTSLTDEALAGMIRDADPALVLAGKAWRVTAEAVVPGKVASLVDPDG